MASKFGFDDASSREDSGREDIQNDFQSLDQIEVVVTRGSVTDLLKFLKSVNRLQELIILFQSHPHDTECERGASRAEQLLSAALHVLLEDFNEVLRTSSTFIDPSELLELLYFDSQDVDYPDSASSSPPLPDLIFPHSLSVLNAMADTLVTHGCGAECAQIYRNCRSMALRKTLERVGMEIESDPKGGLDELAWGALEGKMRTWIDHFNVGVRLLLASEQQLCLQIMRGLPPYEELCFCQVAEEGMRLLLALPLAVIQTKKAPEKIPSLLDMHTALMGVQDEVDGMFSGPHGAAILRSFRTAGKGIGGTVRESVEEFEAAVEHNETQTEGGEGGGGGGAKGKRASIIASLPGLVTRFIKIKGAGEGGEESPTPGPAPVIPEDGSRHHLASYVVNFMRTLTNRNASWASSLRVVFGDGPDPEEGRAVKVGAAVAGVLLALNKNLAVKAATGGDVTLCHLFLLNNALYIHTRIKESHAGALVGVNWLSRQQALVESHGDAFVAAACAKFSTILSDAKEDAPNFAKRLRLFNTELNELCKRHQVFVIADKSWRGVVHAALMNRIVTRYDGMLKKHIDMLSTNRLVMKNYLSTPADVARRLLEGLGATA